MQYLIRKHISNAICSSKNKHHFSAFQRFFLKSFSVFFFVWSFCCLPLAVYFWEVFRGFWSKELLQLQKKKIQQQKVCAKIALGMNNLANGSYLVSDRELKWNWLTNQKQSSRNLKTSTITDYMHIKKQFSIPLCPLTFSLYQQDKLCSFLVFIFRLESQTCSANIEFHAFMLLICFG